MAYTYGSKQATNLHAHAGIIVILGVNNALFPKAPIIARIPYGVHDRTKRKQIVIAAYKKTYCVYRIVLHIIRKK